MELEDFSSSLLGDLEFDFDIEVQQIIGWNHGPIFEDGNKLDIDKIPAHIFSKIVYFFNQVLSCEIIIQEETLEENSFHLSETQSSTRISHKCKNFEDMVKQEFKKIKPTSPRTIFKFQTAGSTNNDPLLARATIGSNPNSFEFCEAKLPSKSFLFQLIVNADKIIKFNKFILDESQEESYKFYPSEIWVPHGSSTFPSELFREQYTSEIFLILYEIAFAALFC
jgi:hypothetical protein